MRIPFLLAVLLTATTCAQAQPTPVSLLAGPTLQLPAGSRPNDVTLIRFNFSFADSFTMVVEMLRQAQHDVQ